MYIFNCMKLLLSLSGMKDSRHKVFVMYFLGEMYCIFSVFLIYVLKWSKICWNGFARNREKLRFNQFLSYPVIFLYYFRWATSVFYLVKGFFIDKFIFCRFYCSYSNKTNKKFKNISFFLLLCLSLFKKHKNGIIIFHELKKNVLCWTYKMNF